MNFRRLKTALTAAWLLELAACAAPSVTVITMPAAQEQHTPVIHARVLIEASLKESPPTNYIVIKGLQFAKMSGGTTIGAVGGGGGGGPFPAVQTALFGQKTPILFGATDIQYTPQSALGSTRWLKITSQVNSVGGAVNLFGLDDRQHLAPCLSISSNKCASPTSVYGNTWTGIATATCTANTGGYMVTVAEYSDSGRTTPTGNQSVVCVQVEANKAYVAENTRSTRGCSVNCEVDNPDGTASTFDTDFWQINLLLTDPTKIAKGDTIIGRTGFFNPTSLNYRLVLPDSSTPYTGSGRITVTSEVWDATNDTNGNPQLKNGFQVGGFNTSSFNYGDNAVPIDWTHLWFNNQVNNGGLLSFLNMGGSLTAYGWNATYNRQEVGCSVTTSMLWGFQSNGQSDFSHNHMLQCPTGLTADGNNGFEFDAGSHPGGTATFNVFESMRDDGIDEACGPFTIEDNLFFNWATWSDIKHPDTMQNNGCSNGNFNITGGTYKRNFSVRGQGLTSPSVRPDTQGGPFYNNTGGPAGDAGNATYDGLDAENNINNLTAGNGMSANNNNNPVWKLNTVLTQTGIVGPDPSQAATIQLPCANIPPPTGANNCNPLSDPSGGTNATITYNMANQYGLARQAGTVTSTPAGQISFTPPGVGSLYTGCFQNFISGENSSAHNRPNIITEWTPTVSSSGSTCRASNGVYFGALTPADSGGHACWNVDTMMTFDNTQTCAAQGLTQAS